MLHSLGKKFSKVARIAVGLGACASLLTGCANNNLPITSPARPMPPMPTVGPTTAVPKAVVSQEERIADAVRAALEKDFPRANAILGGIADPRHRAHVTAELFAILAAKNAEVAAALAIDLPPSLARTKAIEFAAVALLKQQSGESFRWAIHISDPTAARVARHAIAVELTRENPEAALREITAFPPGQARDDFLRTIAAVWAKRDTSGAISWIREQPDGALKHKLTSSVAFEIAQTSPGAAIALAESLPVGRDRWLIYSAIAQTWAVTDTKSALAWANHLPAGEARDAAIAGIQTGLGVPSTSRRTGGAPNGGFRGGRRAAFALGPTSVLPDTPAFTAWLATQPLKMSRDEAIIEFLKQRSSQDVGSIGSWVAGLTGDPSRQRAVDVYFEEVLRTSPANAANWLRSLPSSDQSPEKIEKAAREGTRTDPTAAAAWLRETNLPPFRQEEILQQSRP